jgi:hypothetical protein
LIEAKRDLFLVSNMDLTVRNLTSNVGRFHLLNNVKTNGVYEIINADLVFGNQPIK